MGTAAAVPTPADVMMYLKQRPIRFVLLVFMLATLACGVPSLPSADALLGTATPEPSPTPQGDTITFQTLTYRASLKDGEAIPFTGLKYIGRTDNAFQVEINGQTTMKQGGDSFYWKGVMAPGVVGEYNLRLTTTFFDELLAVGPVNITILNPLPIELPSANAQQISAPLQFSEIVAQYYVPVGQNIPGTSLVYQGMTEQGAQLGGTQDYPYRKSGDSLIWTGQLRDNVVVRYNLRVVSADANGMRVAGVADLWVR